MNGEDVHTLKDFLSVLLSQMDQPQVGRWSLYGSADMRLARQSVAQGNENV